MVSENHVQRELSFSSGAKYKLCIQGYIDSSWSDRLGGMAISTDFNADNKPITFLEGRVADQAELVGIINNIYQMHYSLLSVSIVEVGNDISYAD